MLSLSRLHPLMLYKFPDHARLTIAIGGRWLGQALAVLWPSIDIFGTPNFSGLPSQAEGYLTPQGQGPDSLDLPHSRVSTI